MSEKWPATTEISGFIARAIDAIETRHRTLLPLASLLKRGVAWHNASLPSEVRCAIEAGVGAGEIHVVAATSTLAEGVDLPFQITILADWLTWSDAGQHPISAALFRNIAGRCGVRALSPKATPFCSTTRSATKNYPRPACAPICKTLSSRAPVCQRRVALWKLFLWNRMARLAARRSRLGNPTTGRVRRKRRRIPAAFLDATFLAHRDAASLQEWRQRADNLLCAWESEGLATKSANSTWNLTPRGAAFRASDLSPATCRRLLGTLDSVPRGDFSGVAGIARLNAHLWRSLGNVPEAGSEIARFFAPRSRFAATPADLESLGAMWLRGASPEAIFAALPRVKRAGYAEINLWVEGMENALLSPQWSASYERWLDFVRAGLETWTPKIWRASAILAPFCGTSAPEIHWRDGAAQWESGVDSLWASRALRAGAPGTRAAIAALGRVWPFESGSLAHDPLALAPLQHDAAREAAQQAFDAALSEVGGRHCFAGRNLLELRDWLCAKAGLNK
jgi:helicase